MNFQLIINRIDFFSLFQEMASALHVRDKKTAVTMHSHEWQSQDENKRGSAKQRETQRVQMLHG